MRKILTFLAAILITGSIFAGGLVTNTNQSAMFTRLQNRNASTGIDAVYFNPAGLTKLGNGFYVSINNQTIGQTKTVTSTYPYLNGKPVDYVGKVSAPVYPGAYVAFKTGNLAISAGFNPVGGGGGAKYEKGLPSFEMGLADIAPSLTAQGIPTSAYDADIFFEGSSVYFGYQANVSYKINDMISIAAGMRYVSAANTYKGHIQNISINPTYTTFGAAYNGGMVLAKDFFTSGATFLTGLAASSTSTAASINAAISGGVPATTPLSAMSPATIAGVTQLLGAAGISAAGMNIGTAAATLTAVAPVFTTKAATMTANAAGTQDIAVDAEESGSGITPIISANFSPSENLNVSVRYEMKTKLELTTKVNGGKSGGIFVDGEKVIADMPALLAFGAEYKASEKLMVSATLNTYFDKNVDYDGSAALNVPMIKKNFMEYGLGAEYGLSEKFRISAGWVATSTGVNSDYQNDQRYSTNTNSFGFGFGYRISPLIDLNLGGQYTVYAEGSKDFSKTLIPPTTINWNEKYNKKTMIVGIGLDFYFGK